MGPSGPSRSHCPLLSSRQQVLEPPVPAGLAELTAPQRGLADFLRDWRPAARTFGTRSPSALPPRNPPSTLKRWPCSRISMRSASEQAATGNSATGFRSYVGSTNANPRCSGGSTSKAFRTAFHSRYQAMSARTFFNAITSPVSNAGKARPNVSAYEPRGAGRRPGN